MNITLLSGSPRKNSNSLRVAKGAALHFTKLGHSAEIIPFDEYDIPLIAQGSVNKEHPTPFQAKLIKSMSEAQLVIVITPEYNWFPSAELVNLVHQLGGPAYAPLFDNKVFGFVGVSNGRGGRMPAIQLSYVFGKILNVFNFESLISSKIFEVQFTQTVLDENGHSLGNADFDKGFSGFLDYSLKVASRWHR